MNTIWPNPSSGARELAIATLVGIALCGLLLSSTLFVNEAGASACKLILLLLLVLTLYRGSGILLLVAIQVYLLLSEPGQLNQGNWWQVGVVSLATLGLIVCCLRFRALMQLHGIMTIAQARAFLTRKSQTGDPQSTQIPSAPAWRGPLWSVLLGGTICVALAILALEMVPADERAPRLVGLLPSALRVIELGFVLMTTFLIVTLFVGELEWRRMSPRSATLFVQSILTVWFHRDLRMIARRRVKLKRVTAQSKRP